ncbi:class I SAM-dependent methyltransferase [Mycolicibacterium moriokaense]|nr:class I SAM-dependent methyltransferase [Mycolicibacterium moriokaense]
MPDWSGEDYARISSLQRAMIAEAEAGLALTDADRVLDVGCGDGYLTRAMAATATSGCVVGVDASRRMITTAHAAGEPTRSGPWFVIADARRLPFGEHFDVVVSFNALHWVPEQHQALSQIASTLHDRGRAVIQVVCAGRRPSLEDIAMRICRGPRWASWFAGFEAPFIHVEPDTYGELAASAGLALTGLTVTDREWDHGSRSNFQQWCAVGTTAWTDRLPAGDRDAFVTELVDAYEPVAGRPGLFRFTQMRAELRRVRGQ